ASTARGKSLLQARRESLVYKVSDMDRVLLVDDDVDLCDLIGEYLRAEDFSVELSHDGEHGLQRLLSGEHSIVVLDVMLPRMNGLEVLRQARASNNKAPVILLTARGEEVDRIVGLEIGADDYVPKPVHPRELVARIRAVLRRTQATGESAKPPRFEVGEVEL